MILECKNCEAKVSAEYVANYPYYYPEDEETGVPSFEGKIELWKCPNCQRPFLTDDDEIYGVSVIFPLDDNRINPSLPTPIKSAYQEARSCFKAKAYTATAIMCRKALEGICVEHGARRNNLVENLKELKDRGIIESRLFDWADALRISGNEAAHDVKITVSQDDARDLLEFTNALLEYIFTFRDKFEQFKKRRADAANPPPVKTNPSDDDPF